MNFVVIMAVLVIWIVRVAAVTPLGVRVINPLVTGPHTKHFLKYILRFILHLIHMVL